ncbi:VP2 (capsid protein) [Murine polyomavirus strain A2]|uniref:Minor capsid protein VP2 n=3 Tax=Mus musculus polyomavirus 1 TaxID=1891730 RepID=VP2_POVMA|nr:RecName: Full=Minor capsid protein VP2; AltName: Full=Minor structural protein VP2 [Murine polyomavirus strain A2]AAB59904.1 VP2 (capsid protein) [Murine polyomavirus strain A2]
MGAALTILVDLIEGLAEVSTLTGLSAEAILSGEALAALDGEITALTLEGVMSSETALATMGISEEVYGFVSTVPVFVSRTAGAIWLMQTVQGASTISLGIQRYLHNEEVPTVNRNMALIPWRDPALLDIYFPGVNQFAHALNVVHDWGHGLLHSVGRYVWQMVVQETQHRLEGAVRELTVRQTHTFLDGLARLLENTRWVVSNAPQSAIDAINRGASSASSGYSSLSDYYRQLGLNPPQRRALFNRIEGSMGNGGPTPAAHIQDESGEVIKFYQAQVVSHQRVTPDWMLPLILGLYGDITPTWATVIEEDGPQKKKRRL